MVQMQLLTFPSLPWRARVLALTFPVCTFSPLPSATLSTTICMVLCVLPVLYSPAACSSRFPQHSHMYPIDMCILVSSFIHSSFHPHCCIVFHCIAVPQFIHSPSDNHLACFQHLAITNILVGVSYKVHE